MKKSILLGLLFAAFGSVLGTWIGTALAGRSSGGTYSLPSGNPVVTGTTISSSWANSTLSDIATAMTNSLDRTGATGGMTGVLKAYDGTVSSPGIQWSSDSDTGLYRIGANDLGLATTGVLNEEWTTYGTTVTAASVQAASSQVTGVTGLKSAAGTFIGANADGGGILAIGHGDYGVGVYGQGGGSASYSALPSGAEGAGVVGASNISGKPGVFGWGTGNAIHGAGVYGLSGTGGYAVVGHGTGTNSIGIYGESAGSGGVGIEAGIGGLQIGTSGTAISASYGTSATWDPPSTSSGSCAHTAVTLTGVAAGGVCSVSTDNITTTAVAPFCEVDGTDSINLKLCNFSGVTIDLSSHSFRIRVFQP